MLQIFWYVSVRSASIAPWFTQKFYEKCEYEGLENLAAAYEKERSNPFYRSFWRMGSDAQAKSKGFPMSVVARKLDNPYLEKLLRQFRTSTGNSVIEKTEGFRPMLRTLKEGKGIAILIDQNVTTEDRIFVNFLEGLHRPRLPWLC